MSLEASLLSWLTKKLAMLAVAMPKVAIPTNIMITAMPCPAGVTGYWLP